MDGTAPSYTTTLASASKDLPKVVDHTFVSTLAFDSHNVSSLCFSKGSKRKCSALDKPINLKDGSSLVLGLGGSSNSCTTICSGKEMEEESSIDLGLSINLHRGDNRASNAKKVSAGNLDLLKIKNPVLDLQLSLSTVPTASDVTTISQGLIPFQNYVVSQALAPRAEIVDDGSTSSRWKTGSLVSPLQNVEFSTPIYQNHVYSNPNPVTPSISGPVNQQQRKIRVKKCTFEGCTTGARGASGLCIAHGGGRRCQRPGCPKGAEGKTIFCKAHGGGRRCQHLGCTKSAEGRTDYCIGHGGGRRCHHEGCPRASRGKSGLCIRHGGGKRCRIENCTKSAEGISGLCISHGGGRRCQYPDCTKGAQGSTMFCKAHGGGRRCSFLGCTKGAEGSTMFCKGHGGGKRCTSEGCTKSVHGGTLFCVSHGGGKRCAMFGCTKSARGRTDFCVRHGGGKRCKFEGCTKSAQGSTDFCKAHGGGKRCSWGHLGLESGGLGVVPCDKFARGKSGFCAAHTAQAQEKGAVVPGNSLSYPGTSNDCETTSIGSVGYSYGNEVRSLPILPPENLIIGSSCMDRFSLPEGRVHGGSLMAMLRGGTNFETSDGNQDSNSQLDPRKSFHIAHKWV
ncbi:hypothetical protein DH2020_044374 [Rehmannia glutinosa]|uniref:WRKY19-like zinc finger domain-containing protein n=1 Tax=Rehmannia glutinosa TaxID=99300 RepID=A0ABR0UHS9_REHGL